MSGSHFGSGYWPDDYFGLYFQPEAGGVIVGTLAGSFAGTSSFSGTLEQPESVRSSKGGFDPYYYKRRKKPVSVQPVGDTWTPPVARPLPTPALAPYVPQGWASNAPLLPPPSAPVIDWAAVRAQQEQRRLDAIAAQRAREEEDDEEIMLLLAA